MPGLGSTLSMANTTRSLTGQNKSAKPTLPQAITADLVHPGTAAWRALPARLSGREKILTRWPLQTHTYAQLGLARPGCGSEDPVASCAFHTTIVP